MPRREWKKLFQSWVTWEFNCARAFPPNEPGVRRRGEFAEANCASRLTQGKAHLEEMPSLNDDMIHKHDT